MFIGVCIVLFSWPIFNMGGSLLTLMNTNLSTSAYSKSLINSAYINTISSLGIAIISSTLLSSNLSESEKLKPKLYSEVIINAGIIVATYNDISLNPVVGMILSLFSTISTLILDKYILNKMGKDPLK